MDPATDTDILSPKFYTECITCHLSHAYKCNCNNNNIEHTKHKVNDERRDEKNLSKNHHTSPLKAWEKRMGFKTELIWSNIISIAVLHIITVSWLSYTLVSGNYMKWQSLLFGFVTGTMAGFGVTAGAHRYWCHRSYQATLPLQWVLVICYSVAGQNTIYEWVRDHRVHHKFSETAADPHDANRGFLFSHVGWLMMKKQPEVIREGRKMNMADIVNDPVVQFYTKYFNWFKLAFCFVLPTLVPPLAWGETWSCAVLSQAFIRYTLSLNFTWSVNSFAHLWGNKPYNPDIMPAENWGVSMVAFGEGWHNYHHTFPWDYKAAELAYSLNLTTLLLDAFAAIGFLPPKSFLDASKHSPKKLILKVHRIINDPRAYSGFFNWRNSYSFSYSEAKDVCRVCAVLNNQTLFETKTVYQESRSWWNPDYVARCKENMMNF